MVHVLSSIVRDGDFTIDTGSESVSLVYFIAAEVEILFSDLRVSSSSSASVAKSLFNVDLLFDFLNIPESLEGTESSLSWGKSSFSLLFGCVRFVILKKQNFNEFQISSISFHMRLAIAESIVLIIFGKQQLRRRMKHIMKIAIRAIRRKLLACVLFV